MNNKVILEKTEGSCRTIILNRPRSMNAFNFELADSLEASLKAVAEDPGIRVVVLRGAGKTFSAGGDLKLFQKNLDTSGVAFKQITAHLNQVVESITTMPKPVIAAVQGHAFAAGLGVALACDLVVAAKGAKFSPSFINIALSPNASSSFILPRIIGPKRAAEAFFRGSVFGAEEARKMGMVNYVWPQRNFEKELNKMVQDLAKRPTYTLGRIKKLLGLTYSQSFHDQLDMEREEIAASSVSDDFKEGVNAFVKKRSPKFTGK